MKIKSLERGLFILLSDFFREEKLPSPDHRFEEREVDHQEGKIGKEKESHLL